MENNFNTLIETFFNNKNNITTRKSFNGVIRFHRKEEIMKIYIGTFLDKLSILEDQVLEKDGEYSTTGEALDRYILANFPFSLKFLILKVFS